MQDIHLRVCSIFLAGVIMALLSALAQPVRAHGEDRMLQGANIAAGEFLLTVWTAPARLRTGEIHIETTVFDRNGNPDEQCVVQVALTPLDRTGPPLTALSFPVAGAEAGLREAAFTVTEPGRYRVETTIFDNTGAAGLAAFEVEITPVPRLIQAGIYLLLGASILAGVWMLRNGIDVWFGRTQTAAS
ncbi:MAG: hypothetical protein DCC55_06760 [Chloroflexi bacterium]|nr:MAG: hypothetical protein DCC55_06760 [Chloroflexota bacterium]